MIHEQPFLERIASDPTDVGAKLVYCDWLEDEGRADEAKAIRLYCEIKRLIKEQGASRLHGRKIRELASQLRRLQGGAQKFLESVTFC